MVFSSFLLLLTFSLFTGGSKRCRNQPGDPGFPNTIQWSQLNSSTDGRLLAIFPTGKVCQQLEGGCPDELYVNAIFREGIPGSMLRPNWEQDYNSNPPSICVRNTTNCTQGSVPIYAINATTVTHVQAGVRFAQEHNLRLVVKASGHDYLGRSTAKNSLMIWTKHFQQVTMHDSFFVGKKHMGSAVTVGSGVTGNTLYQAVKAKGKMVVAATGPTVVPAGGYLQGAGHAAISPLFGLGADNALEFQIVTADGKLVTANQESHSELFWALRGGGAGSWGVIISATIRTFSTYTSVRHDVSMIVNSTTAAAEIAMIHARHIFDWDHFGVGHYFYVTHLQPPSTYMWAVESHWANVSEAVVNASIKPFLAEASQHAVSIQATLQTALANDQVGVPGSEGAGVNLVMGSRLIPESVYRHNVSAIGQTYKNLLDGSALGILGHMVAGGKVSENKIIDSAVNPKWRTAKTHVIIGTTWDDSVQAPLANLFRKNLTHELMPMLDHLAGGPGSGAYSNEADVLEPHFQTTFFGPNYPKLLKIKKEYDANDLFIVGGGVGSERWDAEGLCRVN